MCTLTRLALLHTASLSALYSDSDQVKSLYLSAIHGFHFHVFTFTVFFFGPKRRDADLFRLTVSRADPYLPATESARLRTLPKQPHSAYRISALKISLLAEAEAPERPHSARSALAA